MEAAGWRYAATDTQLYSIQWSIDFDYKSLPYNISREGY